MRNNSRRIDRPKPNSKQLTFGRVDCGNIPENNRRKQSIVHWMPIDEQVCLYGLFGVGGEHFNLGSLHLVKWEGKGSPMLGGNGRVEIRSHGTWLLFG